MDAAGKRDEVKMNRDDVEIRWRLQIREIKTAKMSRDDVEIKWLLYIREIK